MSLDQPVRSAAAAGKRQPARSWTGRMIAPGCDGGQGTRASFVAKDFALDKVPAEALLHVTAQGLYRAFVNGIRVGDDLLTPGWTCYDDRIAFQTYDIAPLLKAGPNRMEIWLGDGWYRGRLMWALDPIVDTWGSRIAALAEVVADGAVILATEASWKSGFLPVLENGIYYGEDVDNRVNPSESAGVEVLEFDTALLVPHEVEGVKELPAIAPVAQWSDAGREVYDFGQNAGGYVRFTVQGDPSAALKFQFSEVLGPDKAFDNRNYRSARAELHYTLRGGGPESYAPIFTFFGFRYARVTVIGNATLTKIDFVPITSVPVIAGGFTCGVPAVNQLVMNTIWSQRSNFIEIPTDCPQRDERLGWTGDAQVFAGTACWLADSERFLKKFLRDVMHDQRADGAVPHFSPDPTRLKPFEGRGIWAGSTGWGDVITVMPWQLYLQYGDTGVLEECFPAMLHWLDYLWSISDGPLIHPQSGWGGKGFTFGDWLQPIGDNRKPRPTIGDDCAATLYHFISTDLAAKIAGVLGKMPDAERLQARADVIRAAFQNEYFSPSGRIAHNDMTSWSLAFLYGLVPPQYCDAGKAYFRKVVEDADGLIGTGFIGTPALLPALTLHGMADLAEKIFLNRKVPGWLYQVDRGATSIWERWDALGEDGTIYDPDMNSYNHYAYGAVCQWLFEGVAGIAPREDAPGFDVITLDPLILPALSPVAAWHDCRHGHIAAGWSVTGDTVTYRVTLPQGTTGKLVAKAAKSDLSVNGKPGVQGQSLPAGTYEITFRL